MYVEENPTLRHVKGRDTLVRWKQKKLKMSLTEKHFDL